MQRIITWLSLGLTLTLTMPRAFAAKITAIDATKRLITLDEGTETSFVKKSKVCFYDANGKKAGCSYVRSAKPKISFVKIKGEKLFLKLAVGMDAKLEAPPPASGAPGITAEGENTAAAAPVESSPSYITPQLLISVVGPVSYQNLIYETPITPTSSSMWSKDSAVKTIGLGLEYGLGISSFQLSFGLRTRFFLPKKISSDYDDADGDSTNGFEQYVDTTAEGSSFGLWSDFYWLVSDFGVVTFRLGTGLEFDSSKLKFEAVQKSDLNGDTKTLYAAESSLTAISLRLLPTLDFIFGPIDFTLGTIIYVPLSQSQSLSLNTMNDPFTDQALDKGTSPEEDLKKNLDHKAKAGADLLLSAGLVF